MSRLILLLAVIAVVYWILKSYRRSVDAGQPQSQAEKSEEMVRCAQCGVHLPKSESILTGGNYFCSEAHRRAHIESK